jgi:Plants and Prokaryotes Conserved (PCC) domain
MQAYPLRLFSGDDLRTVLENTLRELDLRAAFVIQGIGSLSVAQLRFAGAEHPTEVRGDLEIQTLAGSMSPDGAHLPPMRAVEFSVDMWHTAAPSAQPPRYCWHSCLSIASRASTIRAQASRSWSYVRIRAAGNSNVAAGLSKAAVDLL